MICYERLINFLEGPVLWVAIGPKINKRDVMGVASGCPTHEERSRCEPPSSHFSPFSTVHRLTFSHDLHLSVDSVALNTPPSLSPLPPLSPPPSSPLSSHFRVFNTVWKLVGDKIANYRYVCLFVCLLHMSVTETVALFQGLNSGCSDDSVVS